MPLPCEQETNIKRIGDTVDKIHSVVTDLALQNERINNLESQANDHEGRIRKLEPLKAAYWIAGVGVPVLLGWYLQG